MRIVTKGEFFDAIGQGDVHPNHDREDYTSWKERHGGREVGRSLPGWKEHGNPNVPRIYMLA